MLREDIVFGPIFSRRLGHSLGINLLPQHGKLCDFDCIYCECGWNKDGLGDHNLPSLEDVSKALEKKLRECASNGTQIDSITFSGDGEPTLNPDFPEIIDATVSLRNRFYPTAKISVLSNATRVCRPAVFEALRKVDNPILKIDAPTDALANKINKPACEYHVEDIVSDLMKFKGDFILQTMFLRSDDFDSSSPEVLDGWMDIVRRLHPREIMVYIIARPTPDSTLRKFSVEEMESLVKPLIDEGFNIQIRG